ncbi:MAG: ABC transporter permease [Lachnospiraceae bacterium]|jgi:teichoic acid transport system permease protein|nr:ABC transporter permease [Lachnospiraceae bacterium]
MLKSALGSIRGVVGKRRLVWDLAKADFRKRFVGSYFGVAWLFIQPMATILVYFCVFQLGMKSSPPVGGPYVLWLIPGIVPWFFVSETVSLCTNCLPEYHYLVKKVVFPVEALPVIKWASCLMVHGIFLGVMMVVFLLYGRWPMLSWVQVVYYALAASAFSLAVGYLTSAVQVFFKDMAQVVGICLQFGIWLAPIMWSPAMFPGAPAWLDQVLKINPVYYLVAGYRDSFLTGDWFWERPMLTLYFWAVTMALFAFGVGVFGKLRPHFSDVL